jgi:hypothetical protein
MKSPQKKNEKGEKIEKEKIWYNRTNKECDVYAAVVAWLYQNEKVDWE